MRSFLVSVSSDLVTPNRRSAHRINTDIAKVLAHATDAAGAM
jgi:hypothetical protein